MLKTLQSGFKYIENESFESRFRGLFSEVNLDSDKLGETYGERNILLCSIITEIAEGLLKFPNETDLLGDAYEYLIGQLLPVLAKKQVNFIPHSKFQPSFLELYPLTINTPAQEKRKN
ncbi:hypothetical protein [Campylobacter helveticus]|uniref:hypothetical protein n=1 Tax=Campylobacter helveticus TaxID=28898 RepID=UPI00214A1440|nr:hypothetical protein [Campylobacter helveticus]MCR2063398.1 hypothetical protein [Campylobacter helveticus]